MLIRNFNHLRVKFKNMINDMVKEGYQDVKWRPNRTMEQLAISGDLGRKTGKGWYDYTSGEKKSRKDIKY